MKTKYTVETTFHFILFSENKKIYVELNRTKKITGLYEKQIIDNKLIQALLDQPAHFALLSLYCQSILLTT